MQRERQKTKQNFHAFLYNSLPSLQIYDVKLLNFTFCWGREHNTTIFLNSDTRI